ncbi:hypothetical protein CspeluHIS016_0305260 [Cutaneotrichosporon spelunceum]|uniref:Uncharacterized protein n=1 Tax=Cutaneotrichosporon spelunceum TaxID=1672016 RepID=A0AAD3TUD4_9TREE|nr:hypothetical protein CspeluHIS016_0305260 [Cutaneotrichosporon spelunceum]
MLTADRIHFLLYAAGCLWSLITWCVSAGLVAKWNSYDGTRPGFSLGSANAVLAWSFLLWIYYVVALVIVMFVSPSNILVCIIIDVCVLFFFLIFGFASVGSLSNVAKGFRILSSYGPSSGIGSLGQATLALGWILVFIVLGTLIYELYYVIRNHGRDTAAWRQSFHDLSTGSMPRPEKRSSHTAATTTAV